MQFFFSFLGFQGISYIHDMYIHCIPGGVFCQMTRQDIKHNRINTGMISSKDGFNSSV